MKVSRAHQCVGAGQQVPRTVGRIGPDIVLAINHAGVVLALGRIPHGVPRDWNGGANGQVGLGKTAFRAGELDECERARGWRVGVDGQIGKFAVDDHAAHRQSGHRHRLTGGRGGQDLVVQHLLTDSDGLVGIDGAKRAAKDPDGGRIAHHFWRGARKPVRADRGVQLGITRRQ
ncbi:Uncharacterised protein [Mycobacterium tuberculosis]|nr:Uncharacterised protein [Mycobacterium tuberculosis]COX21273.1 Uncharacterised protein [Mycobacterium tuberculosis]